MPISSSFSDRNCISDDASRPKELQLRDPGGLNYMMSTQLLHHHILLLSLWIAK